MAPRGGERALLEALLSDSYETKAWQGPNLRGSLRGVTARQAAWRPGRSRHSIWELTLHAAYWKYAVRRMLTGEKRGAFGKPGSNWFEVPRVASEKAWREARRLLDGEHRQLVAAARKLPAAELARRPRGSKHTAARLLCGVASHDVYHTGQIQLLKKLWRDRGARASF